MESDWLLEEYHRLVEMIKDEADESEKIRLMEILAAIERSLYIRSSMIGDEVGE